MTKITNNTGRREGVHTVTDLVWMNPGETRDLELTERQHQRLLRNPRWGMEGVERPAQESPTLAQLNDRRAARRETSDESQELRDLRAENDRLREEVTSLGGQVADLERRIADLTQDDGTTTGPDATMIGLSAKHRGGGSYSVMDSEDKELVRGLDKDGAEAFNAMSDSEKTEYVRKAQAE